MGLFPGIKPVLSGVERTFSHKKVKEYFCQNKQAY